MAEQFEIIELRGPTQAVPPVEEESAVAVVEPPVSPAEAALEEFEIEELKPITAPEEQGFFSNIADEALGLLETGRAIVQPIVGEAVAGIAGTARSITAGTKEGEKTISQIKEAFEFEPSLEETKRNLKNAGELLRPVGEALQKSRNFLGDTVFEATGSAGLATAAFIIPDAIMEVLGARGVSTISRTGKVQRNANKIRKTARRLEADAANKMDRGTLPAAPSIDEIFDSAGILYKEVDNIGGTVKPDAFSRMVDNLEPLRGKLGEKLNAEAISLLDNLQSKKGLRLTASQVEDLRQQAGTLLAKGQGNVDSLLAGRVRSGIDNLLGDVNSIDVPAGVSRAEVSTKLKSARALYSRGIRSEVIGKAMAAADLADDPVNSLKAQFRSLIDPRKKTARMFNASETKAIRNYVKPGAKINTVRFLGNFGIDLGNPRSLQNLLITAGGGAGMAASGPLGLIGTIAGVASGTYSNWLARRMLAKQGQFADQLIRAGRDAPAITKAYLKTATGKNRNLADYTQLLLNATPESLARLPKTDFISKAITQVQSKQRALERGAALPAIGLGRESQNGE